MIPKPSAASPQEHFQALLRIARTEAGLTQMDVAQRMRQPQSFVSKYESGERRLDVIELRDVCQVLGISLTEFIERLEAVLR